MSDYAAAFAMLCERLNRDPKASDESDTCSLRTAARAMVAFADAQAARTQEPTPC